MNYRNFAYSASKENCRNAESGQDEIEGITLESEKSFGAEPAGFCRSPEDEFEIFLEISKIFAEQEYRKRRFCCFLKKAICAFFSLLIFSGIFIFSKNHKADRSGKTKKNKNQ